MRAWAVSMEGFSIIGYLGRVRGLVGSWARGGFSYVPTCPRTPAPTLRNQQHLPRRLPPLQIAMRLLRVGKGVFVRDAQLQLPVRDPRQHVVRAARELLACGDVVGEGRAGEEERAFAREDNRIEWRDCAARASEQHEIAARPQHFEIFLERALADAVVHDMD